MRNASLRLSSIFTLFLLLGLAAASFAFIYLQNDNLDLRKAATGNTIEINLKNSSTKIKPGQTFTVEIEANTRGKNISGIQLMGQVTNVNLTKSGIISGYLPTLDPVFARVSKDGSLFKFKHVSFGPAMKGPFNTGNDWQKVATLNLYPNRSSELKVTFDNNQSGAMELGGNFLPLSLTEKTYNLEVSNTASAPDGGIHRGCNEYCADSRECGSEFSCYYNRCRNPKNLLEVKCTNPVVAPIPAKTTTTPSTTAKGGSSGTTTTKTTTQTTTATIVTKPVTTLATVIITTAADSEAEEASATTSAQTFTYDSIATVSTTIATQTTTRNLGTAGVNPSPSPIVEPVSSAPAPNRLLPILIGAAILTALLGAGATFYLLKNRNL